MTLRQNFSSSAEFSLDETPRHISQLLVIHLWSPFSPNLPLFSFSSPVYSHFSYLPLPSPLSPVQRGFVLTSGASITPLSFIHDGLITNSVINSLPDRCFSSIAADQSVLMLRRKLLARLLGVNNVLNARESSIFRVRQSLWFWDNTAELFFGEKKTKICLTNLLCVN